MPGRIHVPSSLLFVPEIRARLEEGKELTREDYRPIEVTMRVTLDSGTTSDNNTFKVPSTHKFLIEHVLPHLVITSPDDSADAVALSTHHWQTRAAFKASNCRIQLVQDDSNENILGENQRMALSSIFPLAGGKPIDWSKMPYIAGPGETLRMTATLVNSAAKYADGDTEYGVALVGYLVRVRPS